MKIPCGVRSARGPVAAALALLLSLALLQPLLTSASERKPTARTGKAQQPTPNGKGKKVTPLPPERGVPNLNLPNLDQVRQRQRSEPQAPAPIQSTIRSRRKSGKPAADKKSHHGRLRSAKSGNSRHHTETETATLQSGPPPFTNDPLKNPNDPDSFKIQAVHITELRAAINTVRNRRHLPDYSWVKPAASVGAINSNVLISWEPIDEMRTALDQAIGPPAPPGYKAGLGLGLPILADHITELRERVKDILGVTSIADQLVPSRVDLFNQSGNQIEARDCEWSLPLVSLPGRAGLDLNVGLSYSSMLWTQAGSYISFDDDWGDPSPGFKIGFPTIQGRFTNNLIGANVYILITSAGRRVELRRVGSSNIYEAGDSSYLQLIDNGGSLLLRTTDGTQMSYSKSGADWHCTAIEDRNGNLILANYNSFGDIDHITDTLGRTFTFIYDSNYNLQSITQTWTVNGVAATHTWATFGWGTVTMHPAFSGVDVVGVFDGEVIPVLTQVGLADGSHYNFEYNSNGQATRIRRYGHDTPTDLQLAYTAYDYDTPSVDCPRITAARVWANNWSDVGGVPHEVISYFADNHDGSHQMTTPDGTVYKEFYGGSGDLPAWQHGLVTSTQFISGSTVQKTTTTAYTQDNTNVNYQTNPRVSQTVISDGTNTRKTTIDYQTFTLPVSNVSCSLPNEVNEFAADQTTVLRRTHTDYNLDTSYIDPNYLKLNRRIIGLPGAKLIYEGASTLKSKTTYVYDQTGEYLQNTAASAIQHDDYNYPLAVVVGRGNLTKAIRWDVNDANQTANTADRIAYDITGNVIFARDASDHQTSISYADKFSTDGVSLDAARSFSTFAYPTTVTDADGFSSSIWSNYDFAAQARTENPLGAVQKISYDEASRVKQVTTVNTGAYVHYDYGPDYTSSFASVNSVATDYTESDMYTNRFFDGLGRVFAVASNHPDSSGGNKAQWTEYDVMGRAKRVSNPTEITSGWVPTGDDAAGRVYTAQTYDWKGRPLVTTHEADGTQKYASYDGCGCAGGEVATLTDEVGRQQIVYSDVLGRQVKTEIMNGNSIYSTTTNTLNARDEVTLVRQYQGSEGSGVYQDTTMSYDGYGRLQSRHVPEQRDQNNNPTYTTYDYNPDDAIHAVTDGRGVTATYGYNYNRHLVTSINYPSSLPSGVAATANVTFDYDHAGNRISMNDGSGAETYSYDSLSRMSSETKTFSGLAATYTLSYGYNLVGELNSVTDQRSGTSFSYTLDNVGRLGAISASGLGNTTVASNFQYRAWNALKHVDFENNTVMTLGYNSRLLPVQYALSGVKELSGQSRAEGSDFQYYEDGRVKFASDYYGRSLSSVSAHDKAYQYDHVGRLQTALTSVAANNFVATGQPGSNLAGPYQQNYSNDVWDNLANRTGSYWSEDDNTGTQTYDNDRNTAWSYDNAGNLLSMNEIAPNQLPFTAAQHGYDAASRRVQVTQTTSRQVSQTVITTTRTTGATYDGDGLQVKAAITTQTNSNQPNTTTTYYLRSSVLSGQAITDYNDQGARVNSYVYAGGSLVYEQLNGQNLWHVANPLTGDARDTDAQARLYDETHLDPEGVNAGASDPASLSDPQQPSLPHAGAYAAYLPRSMGGSGQCSIDGAEAGCSFAESFRDSGAGEECLDGNCGKQQVTIIKRENGQVVYTKTIDVMPGDPGWNGHLDGTYRVGSTLGNVDISSPSTAANLLRVFDYWGDRPNDYFAKVASAPQNPRPTVDSQYQPCRDQVFGQGATSYGNKDIPGQHQTGLIFLAGRADVNDAAMIASIWAKESNFAETPGGDAGPAQLTSWWKTNHPELIQDNAYGSWNGRTNKPFDGNVQDNIETLGNIVRFSDKRYGNYPAIAYWYGPGDPNNAKNAAKNRANYQADAMSRYAKYQEFFNCLPH